MSFRRCLLLFALVLPYICGEEEEGPDGDVGFQSSLWCVNDFASSLWVGEGNRYTTSVFISFSDNAYCVLGGDILFKPTSRTGKYAQITSSFATNIFYAGNDNYFGFGEFFTDTCGNTVIVVASFTCTPVDKMTVKRMVTTCAKINACSKSRNGTETDLIDTKRTEQLTIPFVLSLKDFKNK